MKVTKLSYAKRRLKVIEGLCLAWENGFKTKPQGFIDDIYKIAHIDGGCKNPHIAWRKEFLEIEAELKKGGLI